MKIFLSQINLKVLEQKLIFHIQVFVLVKVYHVPYSECRNFESLCISLFSK